LLDDNAILYGPKDTWGHKGSRYPYYSSGGSTMTDAPNNLIDMGELDNDADGGSMNGQDPNDPDGGNPNPTHNQGGTMPQSAGGPLDHQVGESGTGGLINTAGGGPAGSRVYNKHGDVVPGSARGMHPDYWDEEVVELRTWGPSDSPVAINTVRIQRSQGSPPSPMYRFKVMSCNADATATQGCDHKRRFAHAVQTVDIGMYEPKAVFYGDLDPKTRVLQGEITVTAPAYSMGLQGFRLYPTNDGKTNLELRWSDNTDDSADAVSNPSFNAQFFEDLAVSCPPDSRNTDWNAHGNDMPDWNALSREPCGNDNPYSPKCRGKSCTHINILPGSQGEFYISRFDNNGNAENPGEQGDDALGAYSSVDDGDNRVTGHGGTTGDKTGNLPQGYTSNTARRNYGDNEWAQIYFPRDGWLTPILMDVPDDGDTLILHKTASAATDDDCTDIEGNCINVKALVLSDYHDISQSQSVIDWQTDEHITGHGWTLIFQPDYPEVEIPHGTPMAQGASGYRVVNVYGSANSKPIGVDDINDDQDATDRKYQTEYRNGGTETVIGNDRDHDAYVETYDWLVPNVTCTPTTMHCPLPSTWAHINYTTPSLYPEPAEGSCLQQKTGTSSLDGCSDKVNLHKRWYSANSPTTTEPGQSQQNTEEEDNGQGVAADTYSQKYANWAGNCGDATSYFWFEKIACGSTRTFHTDRSLIEDYVQLTPTWEDIQHILDLYYTTKAPLAGADGNAGFTFITADYHVAPVLPPKINCTCLASMDAYASLLSVVSKTPTPGAPVTLDPEVLNTGSSKIVATLRAYQDPTYSIPASSLANMPVVVTRFYLEVSTKFTRNRITISDCTASNKEQLLNDSTALRPRMNYCDNSTFDTMTERAPNGVTHMDRLSMKKFKFQTSVDVFMQCKLRACAQQPCGVCTGMNPARSLSNVDLTPAEGEMFAPPTQVKVGMNDHNAMVFPDTVNTGSYHHYDSSQPYPDAPKRPTATSKPIEIASQLTLTSVTAAWAIENRAALESTLRKTLALRNDEEIVITSISKVGRKLSEKQDKSRQLQSSGVKVDFVVGLTDASRAQASRASLTSLASGGQAITNKFVTQLDSELVGRGKQPVRLSAADMAFTQPEQTAQSTVWQASNPNAVSQQSSGGSTLYQANQYQGQYSHQYQPGSMGQHSQPQSSSTVVESKSSSSNTMLLALGGALLLAMLAFLVYNKGKSSPEMHYEANQAGHNEQVPDVYASKVAQLDQDWANGDAGYGVQQANW
jgi:hypothetical protein